MKTVIAGNRSVAPSKIICIGRNYVAHIEELHNELPQEMVVFLKPNSAIADELHSFHLEPLHYEAELCLLFEQGRFSALGFGLDLTKRSLQNKLKAQGLPWERAKAFDGSAVLGQFVEISGYGENITFELDINGITVQTGRIDLMIYKPDEILTELSTFMSLRDGDVVMTGTPKGVGIVRKGDVFTGKIKDRGEEITRDQWVAQ